MALLAFALRSVVEHFFGGFRVAFQIILAQEFLLIVNLANPIHGGLCNDKVDAGFWVCVSIFIGSY